MKYRIVHIVGILILLIIQSCSNNDNSNVVYQPNQQYVPIPYQLELPETLEKLLLAPVIPTDNPLTEEGVALGKKLFSDPILSGDNTQACIDCHNPKNAFTDSRQFSVGIDGKKGTRNSMPLFNLAWNKSNRFAWDGKEFGLEKQALEPVANPIEMHSDWNELIEELRNNKEYRELFAKAFGSRAGITKELVTKALAQFERTILSANSKFDNYLLGKVELTPEELNGFDVFMDENRGDCFHCHGDDKNPLWTDNDFHNNGLDTEFSDLGLGKITGDPGDNGKFRSPSIRNLSYTAPYMHDGRFKTIEEVIEHYSSGLKRSETIDPLMKKIDSGGVQLSEKDKADLKAFLLTLNDPSFVNNPNFK